MDQVLGLILLAGYIAAVIALAAGITWGVIRIFPTERSPKKDAKPAKPEANGSGEGGQGRLFRRSKRGST